MNPYGCSFSLRMTHERSAVDHQKSLAMKPCAGAVSLSFSWARSFLRFSKTCSHLSFIARGANIGRAFENKDKRKRSKALQWQTTERNIDIISFQKRNFLFFSFLTIVSTMPSLTTRVCLSIFTSVTDTFCYRAFICFRSDRYEDVGECDPAYDRRLTISDRAKGSKQWGRKSLL